MISANIFNYFADFFIDRMPNSNITRRQFSYIYRHIIDVINCIETHVIYSKINQGVVRLGKLERLKQWQTPHKVFNRVYMQSVDKEKFDDKNALKEAVTCLLEYIQIHGENNKAFEILKHLANETVQRIDHVQEGRQFTNEAIYRATVKTNQKNDKFDYSSWFSRYWNKLNETSLDGLENFSRQNGYKHFAWISKKDGGGSGNSSMYFLHAIPVKKTELLNTDVKHDIKYIEISNVSPSWWAKWLFNQNFSANTLKTKIYIFYYPIASLLLSIIIILIFWLALNSKKEAFSANDMVSVIFMMGLAYYAQFKFFSLIHFLEDRIIMAPLKLLGLYEKDVSLELVTSKDRKSKFLRLIKYASQCPICQAEILLDRGEPDFPRRIVGRCKESPREHVYSFDRITLTGNKLR